jgi:hypothetical protein
MFIVAMATATANIIPSIGLHKFPYLADLHLRLTRFCSSQIQSNTTTELQCICGVCECDKDSSAGQARMRFQEFIKGAATTKLIKDMFHCDAGSRNNRLAKHDMRIRCNEWMLHKIPPLFC